jgi:glycosyltransferase involved in cell wall biosynthesis
VKIALYGNTCNNFFAVARALRASSDIDAHLYIDHDAPWNQLPESDEPSLRAGYPSWIHRGRYRTVASRLWPRVSPLVREFEGYDLVMVSGYGVQLAPYVPRRFIFYVTGWDLTVAPFPFRFASRPSGLAEHASAVLNGVWQRRGIAAVSELWSQPFAPFVTAQRRLRVPEDKIVPRYFPIMLDTDLFRRDPSARESVDPNMRRLVHDHDFVVFHPSRMMLNAAQPYVDAGQWKGNDRLFEGFARFIAAAPEARPVLGLIDRWTDRAIAQPLIDRLGIAQHVVWLKPANSYGFDRADLLPFYSVADVVIDEFGVGWFGSIVVEGLSMEKPVLCYLDEPVMKTLYPWHPVLTPRTPDEIAAHLTRLYRDPEERARLGEQGRRWAVEFHSIRHAAPRYAAQIAALDRSANG